MPTKGVLYSTLPAICKDDVSHVEHLAIAYSYRPSRDRVWSAKRSAIGQTTFSYKARKLRNKSDSFRRIQFRVACLMSFARETSERSLLDRPIDRSLNCVYFFSGRRRLSHIYIPNNIRMTTLWDARPKSSDYYCLLGKPLAAAAKYIEQMRWLCERRSREVSFSGCLH